MTITKTGISRKVPDAESLQNDPAYRKIQELEFSEMIPFVLSNIRRGGVIPLLYMGINVIVLIFILLYSVWGVKTGVLTAGKIIWQLLAGILAGSILVIVPHELLHGLAYRVLGAPGIKFGADFQQFIFYVTADRFPITKGQLAFLAMTPFVFINLLVILFTIWWATPYVLFSASLLFCHNIMCIGDFAILNYSCSHKGRLYTYDDTEKKVSYFFERTDFEGRDTDLQV
jgi:hypothetical protein